ncbi:MAG: glycoside hydrolase [Chloroflexi bacterium]|nr:glycoside hydrolase [Chloroflexota bacterium]
MVYDTHIPNRHVAENVFLTMAAEQAPLPTYESARSLLPVPVWRGHQDTIDCYWKVWQLAFGNLRQPAAGSGFVSNYIDTAFNGCLFMWDSVFILLFARYGRRAFDFSRTLDNFYAHQHKDGYICREIDEQTGAERFERYDPPSTGPNVMPWAEWEHYLDCGDRERLERVFAPLLAYYEWYRTYRSWPDGTYWAAGWIAMDNQPRLPPESNSLEHQWWSHGRMSWIETSCQAVLAARHLVAMAAVLGRRDEVVALEQEADALTRHINSRMWDEADAYYYDRWHDGRLNGCKPVAGYWTLLADIIPPERVTRFVQHLRNSAEFNRPHRVPTLSADNPLYHPGGDYWRGSVWAPTNYVILKGLCAHGEDALAHEIARNHVENVVRVHGATGTLWENYAPESAAPGSHSKADYVGWSGLPPVAVLFEHVFGLRPDTPNRRLLWDVRLLEEHGVRQYPYGADGLLDLHCAGRSSQDEEPVITASGNVPVELVVRWERGSKTMVLGA